jgi:exodeoxyribonuclease V alpha subunit
MTATSDESPVPSEEIAGLVERITFFNPESGFAVLRVHVRGQWDPVTVLGSLPSASAGGMVDLGRLALTMATLLECIDVNFSVLRH